MENILLKKSFHAKNFKLLKFNSLWGYKGIFTTIRLFGKEPNFILVDQHLKKINKDLRYFGIDIKISKNLLTNFLNKYSKIKNYDHLLRIAVTKKIISLSVRKRNKDHKYFTAKFFRFQRALPNFKNLQYKKIISLQKKINLQKSVASGILTDASYVQFANEGIATLDIGFPMRYSHSSREICNLNDLIDFGVQPPFHPF